MEAENRLQVGIDVGKNQVDVALLAPDGKLLIKHRSFANSRVGYGQARELLLEVMQAQGFEGLDVAAEATSYYWLPLFWEVFQDPQLAAYHPRQLLLNATWVKWFRKSLSPDHKSDRSDPFYIGDHMRNLSEKHWWQLDPHWLSLRLRTRLHSHLSQSLSREKSYYQLILFLNHSAYPQVKPFADTFGVLSQALLNNPKLLAEVAELSTADLAVRLDEWSRHHLPDPLQTAEKLKAALDESFCVPEGLHGPLQEMLNGMSFIVRTLQEQITRLDIEIATLVQQGYPEVAHLQSIPGLGLVTASGIAAEIAGLQRFETQPKWDNQHNRYRPRSLREVEDAVAKFAGLWWPQNASGQFEAEDRHLSKRGDAYLRYYLIQAADHMRRVIPSYTNFYQLKYAQVTQYQHKRALVLTARKTVSLVVGLLHRGEDYRSKEAST